MAVNKDLMKDYIENSQIELNINGEKTKLPLGTKIKFEKGSLMETITYIIPLSQWDMLFTAIIKRGLSEQIIKIEELATTVHLTIPKGTI